MTDRDCTDPYPHDRSTAPETDLVDAEKRRSNEASGVKYLPTAPMPGASTRSLDKASRALSLTTRQRSETLDTAAINAIVSGQHTDHFSVLGMHATADPEIKVLRVFLPGARKVDIMTASGKTRLCACRQIHEDGLFEAFFKRATFTAYTLRVTYPLATQLLQDPYRFAPQLAEIDAYLFSQGTQERAYSFLGANHRKVDGINGILMAVWAPNAKRIAVVGDFNHWDNRVHVMRKHHECGIWEIFIPADLSGQHYKFSITAADGRLLPLKADPYAKCMQLRPSTASTVIHERPYIWQDQQWMHQRGSRQHRGAAISIYEVHLGSWRRAPENNAFLDYRSFARELVSYAKEMGFSHIQLLPVSEHPFDGSWGYQPIGLFSPSSRFGTPDELRYFIDTAHQQEIGVLLDWVPGHFPTDEHGLGLFDGSHLYEHHDPRRGFHPDWDTLIFDYERPEVVSYLLSNAIYWLEEFHFDGLRFDAVASMLYLDYSRKPGEWLANQHGGRENIAAINLLRLVNERAYFHYPDIMMVAEESTAWPGVTQMTASGGLGFGYKWNLGWMNDTLSYMSRDPIHKQFHHNDLTFGLLYAFSENFILPLSHDEVVHGKRSLLEKMPGDDWQKFANLRAYLAFMWTHPGKKLLFMGGEFAQRIEWNHDQSLDWHLLDFAPHSGVQKLVRDLNHVYASLPALHSSDFDSQGFEWIDAGHPSGAVFVFLRSDHERQSCTITACNFTPLVYEGFRVGVPKPGDYRERINTNSEYYGGTGLGNEGISQAREITSHGRPWSLEISLPPLATVIFEWKAYVD